MKSSPPSVREAWERCIARAIAALNHQHICQVYDVGPNYLVLEYIEGHPIPRGPAVAKPREVHHCGSAL